MKCDLAHNSRSITTLEVTLARAQRRLSHIWQLTLSRSASKTEFFTKLHRRFSTIHWKVVSASALPTEPKFEPPFQIDDVV